MVGAVAVKATSTLSTAVAGSTCLTGGAPIGAPEEAVFLATKTALLLAFLVVI
jgi:hypothetical protein